VKKMIKIAIFKSTTNLDYYEDYSRWLEPVVQDWVEVSFGDLAKIKDGVRQHNKQGPDFYVVVEQTGTAEELPKIFKDAQDFYDSIEKQRLKEEKRKAEEKAKRDAKALERKQKQLEKLKKELGEQA
jgi:septin family protein